MNTLLSRIIAYSLSDGVPRRSLAVAAIVGTVLNLINQGDALISGGHVNLLKLLLTYAVPYCVATYGVVSFRMAMTDVEGKAKDGIRGDVNN